MLAAVLDARARLVDALPAERRRACARLLRRCLEKRSEDRACATSATRALELEEAPGRWRGPARARRQPGAIAPRRLGVAARGLLAAALAGRCWRAVLRPARPAVRALASRARLRTEPLSTCRRPHAVLSRPTDDDSLCRRATKGRDAALPAPAGPLEATPLAGTRRRARAVLLPGRPLDRLLRADGELLKSPRRRRAPRHVAMPGISTGRGATWGSDDTIVFSRRSATGRSSGAGGGRRRPSRSPTLDPKRRAAGIAGPRRCPAEGRRSSRSRRDAARTTRASRLARRSERGAPRVLLAGAAVPATRPGHLFLSAGGERCWRAPLRRRLRRERPDPSVTVLEGVCELGSGGSAVRSLADGALVYAARRRPDAVGWCGSTATGRTTPASMTSPRRASSSPISPDGAAGVAITAATDAAIWATTSSGARAPLQHPAAGKSCAHLDA